LIGSSWDASNNTVAIAHVYNEAEYATPVWCRSTHSKEVDTVLNDTMNFVTGCLRLISSTDFLPVLAGIGPTNLHREMDTQSLAQQAVLDENHPLKPVCNRGDIFMVDVKD